MYDPSNIQYLHHDSISSHQHSQWPGFKPPIVGFPPVPTARLRGVFSATISEDSFVFLHGRGTAETHDLQSSQTGKMEMRLEQML